MGSVGPQSAGSAKDLAHEHRLAQGLGAAEVAAQLAEAPAGAALVLGMDFLSVGGGKPGLGNRLGDGGCGSRGLPVRRGGSGWRLALPGEGAWGQRGRSGTLGWGGRCLRGWRAELLEEICELAERVFGRGERAGGTGCWRRAGSTSEGALVLELPLTGLFLLLNELPKPAEEADDDDKDEEDDLSPVDVSGHGRNGCGWRVIST